MPRYVTENYGISGEMYIYRNHAYENMVSREQAVSDGRPVTRGNKDIHFHNLGIEKMTNAILGINDPTMAISTKSKNGNPTVIMILPEFGNNGAPLYAVLSFYSNRDINGSFERKPHIVLTIAERPYVGEGGRSGYQEIIKSAIEEGRVLDYNKKRGDDLSVIANPTRVGNITETFLKKNVAQFRKEVKEYKERNKIQYSLADHGELNAAEIKAVMQENAMLKERVDYWKGQTKRTTKPTMDKKAVAKAARDLVREYGADVDIAEDLQSLYNDIVSGKDGDGEMTGEAAFRRAADIAAQLVENAVAKDDTLYQEYADLRQFLRSTKLVISEEASHDIPDFGDFRKANMGRISVGKGQSNIQEIYRDLAEDYPAFFDEQRTVTESDQLLEIAEVMEKIYTVTEYNPYSRYMEQAVTGTANEILEKFFDLPETKPTFADRQAKAIQDLKDKAGQRLAKERADHAQRLQELRQQNRQKVQEAIQKERDRRTREVDNLKSQYAARDLKGRERRNARELRAKITRHAKALSQKLLKPTDKQHVAENLRGAVAILLDAINLESQYTVTPDGKRVKGGDGNPTKRTEAFMRLRQEYEKITKSDQPYNLVIDPDLMDNLVELSEMRDIRLADMNTEQLATVWAALRAVEASIQTANKAFGASRFETISEFAEGIRADNRGRNDRGNLRSGIPDKMDKLVNVDMLTPEAYFHRLGGTASEIFRMLRNAQDQHIRIMEKAKRATFKITRSSNIEKLEKEIHHVKLSGDRTVTMSTAQIMSLYELLKREQAQDHILVGGIRPDALEQKGLKQVSRAEPYQVTLEDCMEICGVLTKEQQEMADKLQQYLGNELSELGNQASMEVYGYRKFNEPNYFPIKVDQNQTKSDVAKQAQAATIAGRGFTKATAPKAKNAVMISSIFDVYAAHVNDMATYAAWLAPMENLRRIRDFSFWTDGVQIGNVKAIVERVFGKHGNTYLNKLIDDINQGVQVKGGGNLTDGLTGNYKAASVAANLRVVLQQPTAILRALDMIDPKYLTKGMAKKGDFEKVKKYAPIAIWKDWGYFDINTGRQMKNVLFDYDNTLDKVKQLAMAPAGKADSFAWARLWNAVEAEIRDKRRDLKPDTDAFYKTVAERFAEVVDRTQVVDGILQRSQIMRSPDSLTKMATSFMGEPTKTYNMFLSAAFDLKHAKGKDQRKAAGKTLARTTTALVTSFAVNAVMQSIVDAMRDDDKEKDYWEKFSEAYAENFAANFNPLGYIPYAKDLVSIAQGYDVARMDMEPVSRVWDAASQMYKTLSGEGKHSFAGASANLLAEASRLLGVPVANLKRDIHGVILTAAIETDNYLLQYRIDKALLDMGYAQNKKNFMDILYNAMVNDDQAYRTIVADMVSNGMSVEDIRKAMEDRMKKAQGVQSVGELANRYLTPEQTKVYDSMHSGVSGTTVWNEATEEQRAKAEEHIYNVVVGNDDGLRLQEKIAAGAEIGLTETEYILYQLAKEVVGDGNNNTSQDEAKMAINMLAGLTEEERAYLWASTNKGWKPENNPYK